MAKASTAKRPEMPPPVPAPAPVLAEVLAQLVEARTNGVPYMATPLDMAPYINSPAGQLAECNTEVTDGKGNFAYRATELGVQVHMNDTGQTSNGGTPFPPPAPAPAPASAAAKQPTAKRSGIVAGIPIPAPVRGRGANAYGFDTLEIGESFFVAATADRPDPAKGIASTVASAADRMEGRKFIVRSIEDGAPWGDEYKGKAGAAVWREA